MSKESKPIPLGEQTREVSVRETDGRIELVLIDHEERQEGVPIVMQPTPAKRAA